MTVTSREIINELIKELQDVKDIQKNRELYVRQHPKGDLISTVFQSAHSKSYWTGYEHALSNAIMLLSARHPEILSSEEAINLVCD